MPAISPVKTENYKKAVPLGAARWEAVRNENSKSVASVRNEFDILASNYVNLIPTSAAAYSSTLDWFSTFIERWGRTAFLQKNLDSSFINLLVLCNKEQNYPLAKEAYEKYSSRISLTLLLLNNSKFQVPAFTEYRSLSRTV